MMRLCGTVFLLMILFLHSLAGAEKKGQEENKPYTCEGCHGFPPAETVGADKFNAGAHLSHTDFECYRCHNSSGQPEHVNGIIEIRPEIHYELGEEIPWPGFGGGTCGGDKNNPMPADCHSPQKERTCFWMPGNVCKPTAAP